MSKIAYVKKRFSTATLDIIEKANEIIEEYQAQGFDLTLRQLYYQFVSRGYIANKQHEYSRLGSIINDARLAGLVDWDAIVDRTRFTRSLSHWNKPKDILEAAASSFRLDKWKNQDSRVEVWIEKDALVGVIEGVCNELDVAFFSCRGYVSQSEMWAAAQRLEAYSNRGYYPHIIHLGDHDPSGIDMSRDIQDRLDLFTGHGVVQVNRIALTMTQVEEVEPPPNPAKLTDSRCNAYLEKYGDESWELDALDPVYLSDLIRRNVEMFINRELWDETLQEEQKHIDHLMQLVRKEK